MKGRKLFLFAIISSALFMFFTNGCKKKEDIQINEIQTDSLTDIEGHVYKSVKIGNQWWMAENLSVTKYRDGSLITELPESTDWQQDTTGGYCMYNNISGSTGLLYNFYAINNLKNITPIGWHIPSDEEWKELEIHLGMNASETEKVNWRGSHEGEKLKIKSPEGWTIFENVWSTNESGFTALAGGCRLYNGTWGDPGLAATGFWWSSTDHEDEMGWYRHLDYKNANIFRYYGSKNYGFSIRCVKD